MTETPEQIFIAQSIENFKPIPKAWQAEVQIYIHRAMEIGRELGKEELIALVTNTLSGEVRENGEIVS